MKMPAFALRKVARRCRHKLLHARNTTDIGAHTQGKRKRPWRHVQEDEVEVEGASSSLKLRLANQTPGLGTYHTRPSQGQSAKTQASTR